VVCVPDDPFFYGVVMGVLKLLTFNYYWQGTREQIEAVTDRFKTMYYDYQEQTGCMDIICDIVANCLSEEYAPLIDALATAIKTNPQLIEAVSAAVTAAGGGIPGDPVTPEQAAEDTLPDNVRDSEGNCVLDNLWGGMLYSVQSGNRVITDFFEVLEVASNVLEASEITLRAIPAAGDSIATVAAFADKLQEFFAEAYSGAYTEAYEQSLACTMFCLARDNCELSVDDIIAAINGRLTAPMDIGDFIEIMSNIVTQTFVGDEICDVMFLLYFAALKFGQQFGSVIGIRPLSVIISLGADQLSSDNWEILCDCPEDWESLLDFELDDYGFAAAVQGEWVEGVGLVDTLENFGVANYRGFNFGRAFDDPVTITSAVFTFEYEAGAIADSNDYLAALYNEVGAFQIGVMEPTIPVSPETGSDTVVFNAMYLQLLCGIGAAPADPGGVAIGKTLLLRGTGTKPPDLP